MILSNLQIVVDTARLSGRMSLSHYTLLQDYHHDVTPIEVDSPMQEASSSTDGFTFEGAGVHDKQNSLSKLCVSSFSSSEVFCQQSTRKAYSLMPVIPARCLADEQARNTGAVCSP